MDCGFLQDLLVCPQCHGELAFLPGMIRCVRCWRDYPQSAADWVDLSGGRTELEDPEGWQARQKKCDTWYEELARDPERAYHTLRMDIELFAGTLAALEGDVLDVGGGIGLVRDYLPRARRYVSVDPSLGWFRTDWSTLAGRFPCLRTRPCFVRGMAERLPFRSESFNVVLSLWSLNHVVDAGAAFREMVRVLRPTGFVLLVLEDMPPRWLDFLRGGIWSAGARHARTLLRTKIVCALAGRPWPLQDDHYPLGSQDIDTWQRPYFRSMLRAWRGRYLSYELGGRRSAAAGCEEGSGSGAAGWPSSRSAAPAPVADGAARGSGVRVRAARPMMSVIICTYNGAHRLERALSSLAAMAVPADLPWEVIVVDNHSRDTTKAVALEFVNGSPLLVRYVWEEKQGLNHARNRGIEEAAGDILCFIDDDVVVTNDWLIEVKRAFDVYEVVCVGGTVLLKDGLAKPPWWHASYDDALGKFDGGDAIVFGSKEQFRMIGIGANLSFKRAVFDRHGCFQPDLDRRRRKLLMGGDTEFYDRMRRKGEAIMYYPGAVVYQCPEAERFTKQYLLRWHFRLGEWRSARGTDPPGNQEPMLFGLPRWTYRATFQYGYRALACTLSGRHDEGFRNQIQCITCLGHMVGALRARRHQPTVGKER